MFEKGIALKVEELTDRLFNKTRLFLPTIARICLIASFIEDSVRMGTDWSYQVELFQNRWSVGLFLAGFAVIICVSGQVLGCLMILLQKKTSHACCVLLLIILFKMMTYNSVQNFNLSIIVIKLDLVGAVLMVLGNNQAEPHSSLAGVPTLEDYKQKHILQFSGRCLLMFMFMTLLEFDTDIKQVLQDVVGTMLMTLVILGYKTRLSAFVLMLFLTLLNFLENSWWLEPDSVSRDAKDYIRYDFFHALSVVGGLLMVVLHGPGDLSVDARKRQ